MAAEGLALAADTSAVKMTLSANENYLRRFHKECEALAQASDPESAKKLEALDKKIKNLETENERLVASLQKGGAPAAAPVATPAPTPSAAQPALLVSPVVTARPTPLPANGAAVAEWEKMSREEKENYIQSTVDALKKSGQTVERHPLFYTALMDYVFVSDSTLAAKPLKDAVLATIQKNESHFALQKS